MNKVKAALKQTYFHKIYRRLKEKRDYGRWRKGDKSGTPPHTVKEMAVSEYAQKYGLNTLVETGTYLGDMIKAVGQNFHKVYSIEIDQALFSRAKQNFAKYPNVEILLGDSGVVLNDLRGKITAGTLFWLDGHYSGGVTGRGSLDTPITQELKTILSWPLQRMVILIDDARCFVGSGGYPTLSELRNFVSGAKPGWSFEVKHDIIRITSGHELP